MTPPQFCVTIITKETLFFFPYVHINSPICFWSSIVIRSPYSPTTFLVKIDKIRSINRGPSIFMLAALESPRAYALHPNPFWLTDTGEIWTNCSFIFIYFCFNWGGSVRSGSPNMKELREIMRTLRISLEPHEIQWWVGAIYLITFTKQSYALCCSAVKRWLCKNGHTPTFWC